MAYRNDLGDKINELYGAKKEVYTKKCIKIIEYVQKTLTKDKIHNHSICIFLYEITLKIPPLEINSFLFNHERTVHNPVIHGKNVLSYQAKKNQNNRAQEEHPD